MVKANLQPNAQVGVPYVGRLSLDGLQNVRLVDPGGSQLLLDEGTGDFSGTPASAGDWEVQVTGIVDGNEVSVKANLAVLPDPRSLWTNEPSDPTVAYWKEDQYFERGEGQLLIVGASKRGRSHAREGTCRDDHFGFRVTPGDWQIAVVADGAGSAEFSRKGSKVAVETVLEELPALLESNVDPDLDKCVAAYDRVEPGADLSIRRLLYDSLVTASFAAAAKIENKVARDKEVDASKFSTTLIVCVARQLACGDWFFGGFSVGDGGAAVFDLQRQDRPLTTLTLPDSGEFAGQTRFLHTSEFKAYEEIEKHIFFDVRGSFTALTLMTDGITDPKFPTEVVFADPTKWADFWQDFTGTVDLALPTDTDTETQFMEWMDFWSPGNHDDRTLVVLVPRGEGR